MTHTDHQELLIVRTVRLRWAANVTRKEMMNAYRILLRKPLGKRDVQDAEGYGRITLRWMLAYVVRLGSG
jgi:hypothetical protein